jgi:methylmalonyl-CoA mutase N-terminal domain/subunit
MTEQKQIRTFNTASGLEVKDCYTKQDIDNFNDGEKLGNPGDYPFTRGVYNTMYRQRLWTMRQYAGFGTAEDSNKHFKYLLAQGQTGLSVALDLPTQIGLDSDNPLAEDDVGRVGVAIDTLADMETLFDGIPLKKISTNFTINSTAAIILAMYVALAEKTGCAMEEVRGTVQNDLIKEFLSRNTFIFPVQESIKLSGDIIEFCTGNLKRFNPISVSGYHVREIGANAIQEVALTLSAALAYVEEMRSRGMHVDSFAPQLSFQLGASTDFFEEIAKFRVARRMWAAIMKHKYGAENAASMKLRVFSGGNGISLTAKEPLNNIIRGTLQCLIGVLGGAQAIHVPAYDEAYAIPTADSALLCLRTQQIIAHETGIPATVDPLGGSYYIESLSNELESKITLLMDKIESAGGIVEALQAGSIQKEILQQAYANEKAIHNGEKSVVGVNIYNPDHDETDNLDVFEQPEGVLENQKTSLMKIKSERNHEGVQAKLKLLTETAAKGSNVMPAIVEAVKSYASVGEIATVLRNAWGEYKQPDFL